MNIKKKFPDLADMDAPELAKLLRRSTLSTEDRQIAVSCFRWDMDYIEVGAKVNMDRRTVSRHLNDTIVPELRRLRKKTSTGQSSGAFIMPAS